MVQWLRLCTSNAGDVGLIPGKGSSTCHMTRPKKDRKGNICPFECRVPRIARRDKKAFLSDQCKEIEGNNRMGKTRDLFKKIRDTKGTFHAKMGPIKDNMVWT